MKAARILFILFPLLALSCSRDGLSTTDRAFVKLTERYVADYFRLQPERATALGEHSRDHELNDYSPVARSAALQLYRAYLDTLLVLPPAELTIGNQVNHAILVHNLRKHIFEIEELREWEWNPLHYSSSAALYDLISRDYAPLARRAVALRQRLLAVRRVCEQARKNLRNPSLLHTTVALRQNIGSIGLLTETLQPLLDSLDHPTRLSVEAARDSAILALREYGQWMRSKLLSTANRDFRLGEKMYTKKLAFTLDSRLPPKAILLAAEEGIVETENALFWTAWPMYSAMKNVPTEIDSSDGAVRRMVIRHALEAVSERHPHDGNLLATIIADVDEVTAFLQNTGLTAVPEDGVEVIVMPEFQRGVAAAYCDAPGYFEQGGKTYYAVAPTPHRWSAERRTSFYREYNYAMLKNMTVHEAIPGHYLQQVQTMSSGQGSAIQGLYRSAVFAEGWATYAEEMMSQAGFGGPEVRMQQLKMRLRLMLNTVLDYGIHVNGLTESEGVKLLVERGYQERSEALVKWMRACVTSTQLTTYFFGNMEVHDLRARYVAASGKPLVPRRFHDEILRYGLVAPKYIAQILRLPEERPLAETGKRP